MNLWLFEHQSWGCQYTKGVYTQKHLGVWAIYNSSWGFLKWGHPVSLWISTRRNQIWRVSDWAQVAICLWADWGDRAQFLSFDRTSMNLPEILKIKFQISPDISSLLISYKLYRRISWSIYLYLGQIQLYLRQFMNRAQDQLKRGADDMACGVSCTVWP